MPLEVDGPIPGAATTRMPSAWADPHGATEEEYFLSGEATAYAPVGDLGEDGFWAVEPAGNAPFTTRVLVRRPADLDRWNGIVAVEWLNVTAGMDTDPAFGLLYPVLLGDGYLYIGVSAQEVGVQGGTAAIDIPGPARRPLTEADPERYGSLWHPGDAWSYDIYTQVGTAARAGRFSAGRAPSHVIAFGESQSAFRLVSYLNAVHPVTGVYDGALVHSRGAGGAPLSGPQEQPRPHENPVHLRTDLGMPVLQFETETDLTLLGFVHARQQNTADLVTWEVAGAAHADRSLINSGMKGADVDFDIADLLPSINSGPQAEVLRAAFVALARWVVEGIRPPEPDPIETTGGVIQRDADGIALGGVRTPAVDAPVATHTGENAGDEVILQLFGASEPFTDERLRARYPTHDDYTKAVTASADEAVAGGFLLPADRDRIVAEAEAADVPPG